MKSTEIVSSISEFKEEEFFSDKFGKFFNKPSLLERIEKAKNVEEVNCLLDLGKTFKKATPKTMKKWIKAASKKISSFK